MFNFPFLCASLGVTLNTQQHGEEDTSQACGFDTSGHLKVMVARTLPSFQIYSHGAIVIRLYGNLQPDKGEIITYFTKDPSNNVVYCNN